MEAKTIEGKIKNKVTIYQRGVDKEMEASFIVPPPLLQAPLGDFQGL